MARKSSDFFTVDDLCGWLMFSVLIFAICALIGVAVALTVFEEVYNADLGDVPLTEDQEGPLVGCIGAAITLAFIPAWALAGWGIREFKRDRPRREMQEALERAERRHQATVDDYTIITEAADEYLANRRRQRRE